LDRAFEFVGVKRPQNQQEAAVDQASQLIGGTLAGALIPGGGVKSVDEVPGEIANAKIWPSAGATGGVNRQIVTAQVAQRLGAGSGTTTLPWQQLGKEADRITGVFNAAESPTTFVGLHTDQITADIGKIVAEATPHDGRLLASDSVRDLLARAKDGGATAKDLGDIAVNMGKEATGKMVDDYRLGSGLAKVQDYVRGLISDTLPPAQRGLYAAARDQYRTYMDLIRPGMVNRQTGLVNVQTYVAHVAATDSAGYSAGNSAAAQANAPLYDSLRRLNSAEDGAFSHLPIYTHGVAILRALASVAPRLAQRMAQEMGGSPSAAIQNGIKAGLAIPGFVPALSAAVRQSNGDTDGLQQQPDTGP
jgi:hypothetical protein